MTQSWQIDDRPIGPGEPVFVVAELSANHHQDYDEAVRLLHAARDCGADAVKLQTYTPETMTVASERDGYLIEGDSPWAGRQLASLYAQAHMPWSWQPRLAAEARRIGLILFSSPFDASAVEFLERMNCPAYKIASFELVDLPLLQCVAATGKPVILSTGMASWQELCEAVSTLRIHGCPMLALLKCVSSYPALPDEMNLRNIPTLRDHFGLPVGLSDHTLGCEAAVASVALGACIIEKHLTLSRARGGPDAGFSLEPAEFRQLVDSVRVVERALGSAAYSVSPGEAAGRKLRRSLYVVESVAAGEVLTDRHVRAMRPAQGLEPRHLAAILGRRAVQDIARGSPLAWEMVEPADRDQ